MLRFPYPSREQSAVLASVSSENGRCGIQPAIVRNIIYLSNVIRTESIFITNIYKCISFVKAQAAGRFEINRQTNERISVVVNFSPSFVSIIGS